MPRVRGCGQHNLFLSTVLLLVCLSLETVVTHGRSWPIEGKNELTSGTIERILSDQQIDDSEAIKLIFKEDRSALPALLAALHEGRNVERASWALASLGGPKEKEFLRDVIGAQKNPEKKWLMSSFLAGALVEPSSDQEWSFLANCLKQYADERRIFASFSAALALGVNASPKALHLLQTAITPEQPAPDNDAVQEIRQAIHWIKQNPSVSKDTPRAETGSDSEQIKHIVPEGGFYAGGKRVGLSVEDIAFTEERERALVSVEVVRGPKEIQGYDIVLERIPSASGAWKVVGVWVIWTT